MQTEFPERYITLGLKIAYYRKKAGLTQEILAERVGKSVNFIGQVEEQAQFEEYLLKRFLRLLRY